MQKIILSKSRSSNSINYYIEETFPVYLFFFAVISISIGWIIQAGEKNPTIFIFIPIILGISIFGTFLHYRRFCKTTLNLYE